MKKISLLIPAYNEEENLDSLYQALVLLMIDVPQYKWEILFINDGSKDNTLNILERLQQQDQRVNYLDLSRNYGKEIAMMAGFDYVTGDAMVILDADLQHPPMVIKEMITYWEEGYDDVYAQRQGYNSNESWLKKASSKYYYQVLQRTTRVIIQKNTGDFRLLDRICIEALRQLRESQRNTKALYSWMGFRKKGISYQQQDRLSGEAKWSFLQLLNLAIDGITSYTIAPLRIASLMGLLTSLAAFIYMIYIIATTLLWGDPVAGYPTLVVLLLFFGGIQLLCIGVLGEYLGRIFNETKNRPVYFVRSKNGELIK